MQQTYRPTRGPAAYTPDWFKIRGTVVGASESAAACNESRWAQALDLYERKVSILDGVEEENEQTSDMRRGHIFEKPTLKLFADQRPGALWLEPPMLIHPEDTFCAATPDALWKPAGGKAGRINFATAWPGCVPIDSKTSGGSPAEYGEPDDAHLRIPNEYLFQAHQHMHVCGSDGCSLPVLFFNYQLKIFNVPRDDDLIDVILDCERELMERIEQRDPPEPDFEHPRAKALTKRLFGEITTEEVVFDDRMTSLVVACESLKSRIAPLEKARDTLQAEILYEMGDAYRAALNGDDRWLERVAVKRKGFTVEPTEFVELRLKKPRKK